MAKCFYLMGENVAPRTVAQVKALIGKRVRFLLETDIDKSGRGYFFPQEGVVVGGFNRHVAINDINNLSPRSSIREMVIMEDKPCE